MPARCHRLKGLNANWRVSLRQRLALLVPRLNYGLRWLHTVAEPLFADFAPALLGCAETGEPAGVDATTGLI